MTVRVLAFLLTLLPAVFGADPAAEVRAWRADRETRLRAEDGWLSLVGLAWLKPGANPVGSGPGSRVELPGGLPVNAGTFILNGHTVAFEPGRGVQASINGKPVTGRAVLKPDTSGQPDILAIGRAKLHVIVRGEQVGIRIKDKDSPARRGFQGLSWFPIKPEWRIRARFVPQPRKIVFDAQAGDKQEHQSPGYVEWTWKGQKLRLTPVEEDGELFFVFRDQTAGKSTYAAARFLYTEMPRDGFVTVDFNKAYNPPCVFTPYATCPLPPPENRLAIPVEAGEMMYKGH